MKHMKKITALVLALLLLIGLTGCQKAPAGNTVTIEGEWVWADRYDGAFSADGYYFLKNFSFLSYLDTASCVSTVLCTKVGCLHDQAQSNSQQEACEAYMSNLNFSSGGSCFWDGSLYYIDQSNLGVNLYRCNAIGTDRKMIGKLATAYIENQQTVSLSRFARVENYWYYYATVNGTVYDEESETWENKQLLNYIGRIDLRTGKEELVVEDSENTLTLCAAQENAVLYTTRGIPEADLRDPAYREQLRKLPVTLYYRNVESKEPVKVFEKDGSNFGQINLVVGEKLYYGLSEQKEDGGYTGSYYVYDLKTGSDTLFAENEAMQYLGGEYVKRMELGTEEWYIFGLESGKQMPINVSSGYPRMECWSDQGCAMFWQVQLESGEKENRWCYVTYEAMADGLQDEDMLILYSRINGEGVLEEN